MSGYLIRGAAAIMTGLPGVAARAAGPDIRIADGHVEAIGALEPRPGERVLDASGCAVYPGWVNTHHHLAQCVLKGVPAGINLPLMQWLDAVPYRYRYRFDEDLLRTAAEIGIAELMLSGVTTVADHHYVYWPGIGYDPAAVLFDAAGRLGVRFVLCRGGATVPRDFEARDPRAPKPETLDGIVRDVARLVEAFHDPGPEAMRRVALAPSTPTWSVRPDELNVLARAARELGIRRHSHLSETADYVRYCREVHGMLPVQFVAEHDWLGPDVWFAHMVHLADEEIGLVADSGTGIAHCPASNCRLGSGIARAPELAARGAPVSLGVDGAASNESSDMIAEAHLAWYVHRARGGAGAVTVEDVVHWGTHGGAAVLGIGRIGVLAPGYCADLAVYDLDDVSYAGLHDVAIGPVAAGGRPALKWLMVGGEIRVEDDAIVGVELPALIARAREAVRKLAA